MMYEKKYLHTKVLFTGGMSKNLYYYYYYCYYSNKNVS